MGGHEVALEVHPDDVVPLLLAHVDEEPVPQDAGVVDQHVEVAERLDRRLDQALAALPVGHVVTVGDGTAAGGHDLGDHLLGRGAAVAAARTAVVGGPATVVHHDGGALGREEQGVLTTDAAPSAGDDRDPSLERSHVRAPRARPVAAT